MRKRGKWSFRSLSGRAVSAAALCAAFVIGCLLGSIAACGIDVSVCLSLRAELLRWLDEVPRIESEGLAFALGALRLPFLLVLFSCSAVGVVGIPTLFLMDGFLTSYTAALFYRLLGGAGVLRALVLLALSAPIRLPALLLLGETGLARSRDLLYRVRGEERAATPLRRRELARTALCLLALGLCALLDCFLIPILLQTASGLLPTG